MDIFYSKIYKLICIKIMISSEIFIWEFLKTIWCYLRRIFNPFCTISLWLWVHNIIMFIILLFFSKDRSIMIIIIKVKIIVFIIILLCYLIDSYYLFEFEYLYILCYTKFDRLSRCLCSCQLFVATLEFEYS